jgi:hypothetical protein
MLKRTKGRFLLTMLVITGLAGTFRDSSLTNQERKVAVTILKETKSDILKAIKGLSDAQLNFKPAPDRWSIKECVSHITLAEKNLWDMLGATMKEPATPEKRTDAKISDEDLVKMVEDRTNKVKTTEPFQPSKAPWQTTSETLTAFKAARADHIKYAKSTTEDLRDHFIQLPFGWVDCYQFILFMSAHSNRHLQQINEIRADPAFPKN